MTTIPSREMFEATQQWERMPVPMPTRLDTDPKLWLLLHEARMKPPFLFVTTVREETHDAKSI